MMNVSAATHRALRTASTLLLACSLSGFAIAQDAKAIVASAVRTEMESNKNDHTAYIYRDHDVTPEKDTLEQICETPQGSLKILLADHGKPLTPEQRADADRKLHDFLNDTSAQQKAKRDSAHDDEQADEMLRLLPTAFIWTVINQTGELITLDFKPDPNFNPHSMEQKVLSAMAGQIVVARGDNRIRTIRGTLVDDVKFGFGILGRLYKGGSFVVERREIIPHHWQVTESHVHINGHALFFKTIGSQEDETRGDFKVSNAQTLRQAYDLLMKK